MISSKGISKKFVPPSLDFNRLREEGMDWIRALSGDEWTDHNTHDPGITTLEVLCYALTELGYRTEILSDAFARKTAATPEFVSKYFLRRQDIVDTLPVTTRDFEAFTERSHPLVLLAWFVEHQVFSSRGVVEGGYEVSLLLKDDVIYGSLNTDVILVSYPEVNGKLEVIIFDADNRRFNWRNIERVVGCTLDDGQSESFVSFERYNCQVSLIMEVIYQNRTQADRVQIKARVFLSQPAKARRKGFDIASHQAEIVARLQSAEFLEAMMLALHREKHKADILTDIRQKLLGVRNLCEDFTSFRIVNTQELKLEAEVILEDHAPHASVMLDRIYDRLDAYLLQYVVRSKAQESQRKNILYGSNLIEEIVGIDGVVAARIFSLNLFVDGVPTISMRGQTSFECINLQRFSHYVPMVGREKSNFTLMRSGMVEKLPDASQERNISSRAFFQGEDVRDEIPAEGMEKDITKEIFLESLRQYHSIRNDFPEVYHLKEDLLRETMPDLRKTRALQFTSYLLFFEKILIGYLDKLYHLNDLLSLKQRPDDDSEREIDRLKRYFPEIVDWRLIDEDKWEESTLATRRPDHETMRRHKIIDHLLARFASPIPFMAPTSTQTGDLYERLSQKILLLDNISIITRERALGIGLKHEEDIWNSDLLSGFQKRVYFLMGVQPGLVKHIRLSDLPSRKAFGFYLVEHILLVRRDESNIINRKFNNAADLLYDYILNMSKQYANRPPYSFQVSVVLPGWGEWKNQKTRIEGIVQDELPAHILPTFHWLNKKNMVDFESCYEDWLKALLVVSA